MELTRLSWTHTPAKLEIKGNGAQNLLDLTIEKPRLEMESTRPQIKIDQSACFEECGLAGVEAFRNANISHARSMMANGISRIISDGDALMNIQNGGDAIAEQADYNAYGIFQNEYGYGAIPMSRPTITVDPGTLNYTFTPGRVVNNAPQKKLEMVYTPGRFDYEVK